MSSSSFLLTNDERAFTESAISSFASTMQIGTYDVHVFNNRKVIVLCEWNPTQTSSPSSSSASTPTVIVGDDSGGKGTHITRPNWQPADYMGDLWNLMGLPGSPIEVQFIPNDEEIGRPEKTRKERDPRTLPLEVLARLLRTNLLLWEGGVEIGLGKTC
jgi:hypothetical protein